MCWKTSMVKTTVVFIRDKLLGALIHFNFFILILSITIRGLTLEKNIIAVITQNRQIDDNLERQIKNQTFPYFQIIPTNLNFSKYQQLVKSIYPPSLFNNNIASQLEYIFFMVNSFSVDQVDSCLNWANNYLFIIPGELPTLNLPIKSHPSLSLLFFLI